MKAPVYTANMPRLHTQASITLITALRVAKRGAVVNLRNEYQFMRASDWDGDVPMRAVAKPAARWGRGNASPEGRAA